MKALILFILLAVTSATNAATENKLVSLDSERKPAKSQQRTIVSPPAPVEVDAQQQPCNVRTAGRQDDVPFLPIEVCYHCRRTTY